MEKLKCIGCVRDLQYPMFRENMTCESCKRRWNGYPLTKDNLWREKERMKDENEYVARITLYDSMLISDLVDTQFNLYGANNNPYETWTPISYEMAKNYDIVIERSITRDGVFVIIKLGENMREDLRWKVENYH